MKRRTCTCSILQNYTFNNLLRDSPPFSPLFMRNDTEYFDRSLINLQDSSYMFIGKDDPLYFLRLFKLDPELGLIGEAHDVKISKSQLFRQHNKKDKTITIYSVKIQI